MRIDVPAVAGVLSTCVFALVTMPMLTKAARTNDLFVLQRRHLLMSNAGNILYSFYVFSLSVGPVWALHAFNMAIGSAMLTWWLRYRTHHPSPPPAQLISRGRIQIRRAGADGRGR